MQGQNLQNNKNNLSFTKDTIVVSGKSMKDSNIYVRYSPSNDCFFVISDNFEVSRVKTIKEALGLFKILTSAQNQI